MLQLVTGWKCNIGYAFQPNTLRLHNLIMQYVHICGLVETTLYTTLVYLQQIPASRVDMLYLCNSLVVIC